jgi:spore germination cell wall hydrolase CwlJ-like protein
MLLTASLTCLALNIYFEARSEDLVSQISVAQVTLNRVASEKYPDTVCGVVTQKDQFSWYWDGKSDKPRERAAWRKSLALAEAILDHPEAIRVSCVGEATHYHASYVSPNWSKSFTKTCKVDNHIFYSNTISKVKPKLRQK